MPAGFRRHLVDKTLIVFVAVISPKYALLMLTNRHFLKQTDLILFE